MEEIYDVDRDGPMLQAYCPRCGFAIFDIRYILGYVPDLKIEVFPIPVFICENCKFVLTFESLEGAIKTQDVEEMLET